MATMTEDEFYQALVDNEIVTQEEIDLVCDVAGYSERTFEYVLYSRTGYNTMAQYLGEDEDEEDEEES